MVFQDPDELMVYRMLHGITDTVSQTDRFVSR
jgi:hypothetical protein